MDPITQGAVGATAAQLVSTRKEKIAAAVLGFFSGMAADLDVLIKSKTDPLLFLEYHRHFTHALIFIPVGALICTLFFRWVLKRWFLRLQIGFVRTYWFCFAGYATHAVLDACTTYGTQLFWPFSRTRIAWNNVSVVDPLFTVPLLLITGWAIVKRSNALAITGSVFALVYLGLGVVQNQRAQNVAYELAQSRGHNPVNLTVKPGFANLVVWKSVYEHRGRYYVDAVRVLGRTQIYPGRSAEKLDVNTHYAWLNESSQQARDIERFRWFSNNHLGIDPNNKNRIIDIRYSLVPNRLDGMWGIVLKPGAGPEAHVGWTTSRPDGRALERETSQLWKMILGQALY